jgi:hypothetical protein
MVYREQALVVYEQVLQRALEFRKEGQEVATTFFFIRPENALTIVPAAMLPASDKDQLVLMVRSIAARVGAEYVIHVGEAWVSAMTTAGGGAPSEQPDRQEVVIVNVEGPGLRRMTLVPVLPNGEFGEPTVTDEYSGRMTGLTGNADPNDGADYN